MNKLREKIKKIFTNYDFILVAITSVIVALVLWVTTIQQSRTGSNYYSLVIFGYTILVFSFAILAKNKWEYTSSLSVIFTVSTVLIGIGLLKPDAIILGDIHMRINRIEEKIRPFVLVSTSKNQKIIHSTFKDGIFELLELSLDDQYIQFSINGKSDFIKIIPNGYNKFTIHRTNEKRDGEKTTYTAYWSNLSNKGKYKLEEILIEAIIKN